MKLVFHIAALKEFRDERQPGDEYSAPLKWQLERVVAEVRAFGEVVGDYLMALRTRWQPVVVHLDDPRNADLRAQLESDLLSEEETEALMQSLGTESPDSSQEPPKRKVRMTAGFARSLETLARGDDPPAPSERRPR